MEDISIMRATEADFPSVFPLIQALWSYNTYDETKTRAVYSQIVASENSFAFVARKGEQIVAFCHGDFFNTLWMCGLTCYLSGIITVEQERGQGIGKAMLDKVKAITQARGGKAIILESGLSRTVAHRFYEHHGFEKSCYGFECVL